MFLFCEILLLFQGYLYTTWYYLQDKIAQYIDPTFKKSAMYSNISAAIDCYV